MVEVFPRIVEAPALVMRVTSLIICGAAAGSEGFDADIDGFAAVNGGVAAINGGVVAKSEGVAAEPRAWMLKVRLSPPIVGALPLITVASCC
jgi:hypothetical protein